MAFSLSENFDDLNGYLNARAPGQSEFHQAVIEVMEDIKPIIDNNSDYKSANIFERITEPERIISFQVPWEDDTGKFHINRGYRVQFNGAIGPYKGGLRFHPSVNTSILKFLGFEQTFKNALTGLPMGGGKGGSDFNPKGRSEAEIRRFCQSFMTEIYRYIGTNTDIPAGDINVGAKEIGYMFGTFRRITNNFEGVLTGKCPSFGGSELRTEATGYGVLYFLQNILKQTKSDIEGQTLIISGSGNVATYAAEKAVELGANVISLSDSAGFIHDPEGLDQNKIDWVRTHKSKSGATLEAYVKEFGGKWIAGEAPWSLSGDIAMPCATQNELDKNAAKTLIKNGVSIIIEGANMPCTAEAKVIFKNADVIFAPGKAANAGGVAVSGIEISQGRQRRFSDRETIDADLKTIMAHIHESCVAEGERSGKIDYAKGANIAGFRKVANAMVSLGI